MFSLEFLHQIRNAELAAVVPHIPVGARILEIGGGTGFQAKLLQEMGYSVECLDMAGSNYAAVRVFPVREFDGIHLPFAAQEFDVVFSSNVLEHVADLPALGREMRRVLRQDGMCVHVLPSATWRLWTIASHYPALPFLLLARATGTGRHPSGSTVGRRSIGGLIGRALWPARHGELGNTLTEIYHFSRWRWLREFRAQGFVRPTIHPLRLFYTGNMVLGRFLPLGARRRLAVILGSSSNLYCLKTAG